MIIRPIVFTAARDRWLAILEALGGAVRVGAPGWTVVDLAGGRVALHGADEGRPAGTCRLGFEVESFEEVPGRESLRYEDGPDGPTLRVEGPSLPPFGIEITDGARTPSGAVQVAPLALTPDVARAADVLAGLGLRRRLTSEGGGWADLTGDGILGVHRGSELGAIPGFEAGDLDPLVAPLEAAGANPRIIDESYGRTLQFDDPDGGEAIWINETQTDLYGYRSEAARG